jgi:hypothetical protein
MWRKGAEASALSPEVKPLAAGKRGAAIDAPPHGVHRSSVLFGFPPSFMLSTVAGFLLAAGAWAQLPAPEPPRAWTAPDGRVFQATLLSFDGTTAILRMANGQRAQAPSAKLSQADQDYLAQWLKKQPIKVAMPDTVAVETSRIRIEIVSEDAAAEKYVYRTNRFEFESQGKFAPSLLREVARNFEATYELLRALPWGIDPQPPSGERFRARLFKDRESYHAAGAPPNSAGVYSGAAEMFLVPFESIGVKAVGKSFAKDDDFDHSTLVHELTHQMMHFWLRYLPLWVVEGTAEYTSNLPLRSGRFRVSAAKNGLKDYAEFLKRRVVGGIPEPYPLDRLFRITDAEWMKLLVEDPLVSRRLYFTSYLLVYYFMHLDGKGDGQRFVRYFREVNEARLPMLRYQREMAEFFKHAEVKRLPDGRYTWPSHLKHPEMPAVLQSSESQEEFRRRTLEVLLDGRTEEELMKEIRSAYARLGIRL